MASINIHTHTHTYTCIHIHTEVGYENFKGFPKSKEAATPEPELHRNPGSRLNINSVLNGYISNAGNKLYTYTRMWARGRG